MPSSKTVRQVASTRIPTKWGMFQTIGFEQAISNEGGPVETAIALVLGDLAGEAPLLRIHSQCLTSEVLCSLRCDCQDQLHIAMEAIAKEGRSRHSKLILASDVSRPSSILSAVGCYDMSFCRRGALPLPQIMKLGKRVQLMPRSKR